jgi:hypothetical protein
LINPSFSDPNEFILRGVFCLKFINGAGEAFNLQASGDFYFCAAARVPKVRISKLVRSASYKAMTACEPMSVSHFSVSF